jgi:hypothetical protein
MLIAAMCLAFVYGVDMQKVVDAVEAGKTTPVIGALPAQFVIVLACGAYIAERWGRHMTEEDPFLEW